MKSMKSMTVTIVAIALVGALTTSALAQPPRGARAPRAEREATEPGTMRFERLARQLDLSAEQQEAIAELRTAARQRALELRKEMARVRHELRGEMLKDQPAEDAVVRLHERLGELQTKLKVDRAKTRLAVREQLTPEQRDEMLLRQQSWSQRRGGDFERGDFRGRGSRGRGGFRGHGFCWEEGQGWEDGQGRQDGRAGKRSGR